MFYSIKKIILIVFTLFVSCFSVWAVSEVSDESFFAEPRYFSPLLSPSGKYLLQVVRQNAQYRLMVSDLNKSEIVYKPFIGRAYPSNLSWVSDRRVVYQQNGNLISINIDGKDRRFVLKNLPKIERRHKRLWYKKNFRSWSILHSLPDSPDEILTQMVDSKGRAKVVQTNLFTGNQEEIVDGKRRGINSWVVDQEGGVVAGNKYKNGRFSTYLVTNDKRRSLTKPRLELDPRRPVSQNEDLFVESKPRFVSTGDGYLDTNFSIIGAGYEPGLVYVSEALTSDKYRLSKYSLIDEEVVEVIHEDSDYDVGSDFYWPKLHFLSNEKKLVGITYYRDEITSVWLDDRFKKLQSAIDRQYPHRVNQLLQWSSDLRKILVYAHSPTSLGKYYIFYPEQNRMVLQSDEDVVFGGEPIPDTEVVRYESPDNVAHESYLTFPLDYDRSAPLPTVVMVHGGPWWRYSKEFDAESVFFASKGFAVLRVNFRGSTGFGKKYFRAGEKNFSKLMVDDIADGAKWAVKEGIADPNKIFVMGSSYGGYAAIMSLVRYPDLYSAAVSFAAPLDLEKQIKYYRKNDNDYGEAVWKSAVGSERKLLRQASPIYNIENISRPHIVVHGREDDVVPVEHAEDYKYLLEEAGGVGEVYIIRDEGHGFEYTSNQLYYVNKALGLFNDELN